MKKDYLICVSPNKSIFDNQPLLTERLIGENEDYVDGVVRGLELAYPKNSITKEEI